MTDKKASILLCATCFVFSILYRVLGAGDGGIVSMVALFFSIVGVGGLVNANYLLIELRVPPETLGASMVILLTLCVFICGCAPNLAYLPQPIPLYIMMCMLILIFVSLCYLPEGGLYLPKEEKRLKPEESLMDRSMIQRISLIWGYSHHVPIVGPVPNFTRSFTE